MSEGLSSSSQPNKHLWSWSWFTFDTKDPVSYQGTSRKKLITRTVRQQVLKWARFVFRIIFRGFILIGWRAANNHVHAMVQVAKNEMWASALLA